MSSRDKITDENVDSAGSMIVEEDTSSVSQENQHQLLNDSSPVPATSQANASMASSASLAYALPSFSGFSPQQKLEKALERFTHIDTMHCCCKGLNDCVIKLSKIYHGVLTTRPEALASKDLGPSDLYMMILIKLSIAMEKMDFSMLERFLQKIKENITFINEHFNAFLDNICCLYDKSIDCPTSVYLLEQIKTKMFSINLKHESSMKQVDEITQLMNNIIAVVENFQIIDLQGVRDEALDECLFKQHQTVQDLQSFIDRLGTEKKFFDDSMCADVVHMQASIRSTDVAGRLDEAFYFLFDESMDEDE